MYIKTQSYINIMGCDKLLNFISKNLNIDSIETNVKIVIANNIMFDISFLLYQTFLEIEEEINNIIKLILALPFNFSNNLVQEKIYVILNKKYWSIINLDINKLFDGFNEEDIIKNFITYLTKENYINKIVALKLIDNIETCIIKLHNVDLIKNICIIFDGIPSYSKILEQRRRRLRNYIESTEKKIKSEEYFKHLENTYEEYDSLTYDYFKWLKNRFIIDKSFGPISPIIIYLEEFIYQNLVILFPYKNIIINSGKINGEADYKIFKLIYDNDLLGDICIHTIDSDLVHQIIVQQNYFNIKNIDINLSVVKYNYKNNVNQYIEANVIIKNIDKLYNSIYNKFNNNIIYDLALIFMFFGNDHIPTSFEIGPELNINFFLKTHYDIFKNNDSIINLKNDNINFSFENLKKYLKEIYKRNEINKTKILLTRYFKLNYNLISYFIDKLELTFLELLDTCKKILFDSAKETSDLDEDDIRYTLINKYKNVDFPEKIKNIKTIENDNNLKKLLEVLDKNTTEDKYYGLPVNNKILYFFDDYNKNIYNIFVEHIVETLEKKNKLLFEYIELEDFINNTPDCNSKNMCHNYLKKIYHLSINLFGNMKNYNSNNYTYYKYYKTPTLIELINYLDNNILDFNKEIEEENTNEENYINSIKHFILITPHLKLIINKYNTSEYLNLININFIDNLWFVNNDNFKFKDIQINCFIKLWNLKFNNLKLLKYNIK